MPVSISILPPNSFQNHSNIYLCQYQQTLYQHKHNLTQIPFSCQCIINSINHEDLWICRLTFRVIIIKCLSSSVFNITDIGNIIFNK